MKKFFFIGRDYDLINITKENKNNFLGYCLKSRNDLKNELLYFCDEKDLKKKLKSNFYALIILDNPKLREKNFKKFKNISGSYISEEASIFNEENKFNQKGVILPDHRCLIIQDFVKIFPLVRFGVGCKFNVNSQIHHESKIGNFVTIAPSALILGNVQIGDYSYIGAGSIIKENVKIGKNCVIGAGSVVLKDVTDNKKVAGVPAKKIN